MVPSNQIASKVGAGAASGALSVLIVWGLGYAVTVPTEVAVAIATLLAFGAGWLAKAEPQLQIPQDEA